MLDPIHKKYYMQPFCFLLVAIFIQFLNSYKVSKAGDRSLEWPEGSLINLYYTES